MLQRRNEDERYVVDCIPTSTPSETVRWSLRVEIRSRRNLAQRGNFALWLARDLLSVIVRIMSKMGWFQLGNLFVNIEDDLVTVRPRGMIVLEDMKRMLALYTKVRSQHGSLFVLYDSRENTGLDPAARKYATDHTTPEGRIDAAASFGASYTLRVFVTMMQRAASALGRKAAPTVLFDTEEQARQYLYGERARLTSK